MKKILLVIVFLFLKINAQIAFLTGYNYTNRNLPNIGMEVCLDCDKYKKPKIFGGISTNFAFENEKTYLIPEINITYSSGISFIRTGSSIQNIYLILGPTWFNNLDIELGYSYPYDDNSPQIKGFIAGLKYRISKNKIFFYKFIIGY